MKKLNAIIIAMALVLSLGQCKKQETPATPNANDGMVYITVNVDNGSGRHHIEPGVGAYVFTNEDILYVGNDGQFVGTLTYNNGAFTGGIQSPSTSDYLHFYFLGGKGPQSPAVGTVSFTVSIADQSSNLPVLSYGRSTDKYTDGSATYSTTLRNKCALVKFGLTDATTDAVTISNMLTTATVDFETPGITPVTNTNGAITLYSESGTEKWAILLPQNDAIEGFTVNIGDKSYNVAGSYSITNNGYINSGIEVENSAAVDLANIDGNSYTAQDGDVLTGTLTHNLQISIADGAQVTLRNVNINGNGTWSYFGYAGITCEGDATIILEGANTVKGFECDYPGVYVPVGKTLIISGEGSLNASTIPGYSGDWSGAGIGGSAYQSCGNIQIESGTITATGGRNSAGIGGGEDTSFGNIWIKGGTVTATGGGYAAGIGGGYDSYGETTGGNITIDNTVTRVTATRGANAPYSIGPGKNGTCGTVTIGGTVGYISQSPYTYEP